MLALRCSVFLEIVAHVGYWETGLIVDVLLGDYSFAALFVAVRKSIIARVCSITIWQILQLSIYIPQYTRSQTDKNGVRSYDHTKT